MIRVSFFSRNVASIFCSYHQFFFSNKHRQSKRSSERIESNIPIFPLIIFHPSNVPNYFPNPLISPLISQIFSQIVYIPSTHPSTKPFPSSPPHSFPPFTIITQVVVGASAGWKIVCRAMLRDFVCRAIFTACLAKRVCNLTECWRKRFGATDPSTERDAFNRRHSPQCRCALLCIMQNIRFPTSENETRRREEKCIVEYSCSMFCVFRV